jgi:hypothetical protein
VNTREQPGHWEVDTVHSLKGKAILAVGPLRFLRPPAGLVFLYLRSLVV